MKNKKIAALLGVLLAGSMAFSLSACGSTTNASANQSSTIAPIGTSVRTIFLAPAIPALMTATAPASKRFRSTRSTPIRMLTL